MRLLLLLLLLAGPAFGQEEAPAEPPANGEIAVEATAEQDAAIAERLEGLLTQLGGYEGVQIAVGDGIVRLTGEAEDPDAVTQLEDLAGRVEGVVAVENEVRASTDVARRSGAVVERFRDRLSQAVVYVPLLAIALGVFVVVLAIGLFVARRRWPWEELAPNAFVADVYRQAVRLAFLIFAVVLALDVLGATALLGTILGAAGIVGLAIGFAVRDTVENFIASVMLSFRQPFRPSDEIEIEGDRGKVMRLTSRATIIMDFDGNQIRIPNATVFKSRIVNYTRNRERRFQFEIGVASDSDLAHVRDVAQRTVVELPFTLAAPEPAVWIERIGDGAIILVVTGWIDQEATGFLRARGEAIRLVKDAIEAMGVEVPDTTYRVQLLGQGTAQVSEGQVSEGEAPAKRPARSQPAMPDDAPRSAERALERIMAAEQREPGRPNLLSEHAPEE